MVPPFIYYIDSPASDQIIDTCSFRFSGWIASKMNIDPQELVLKTPEATILLNFIERPDVLNVYPDHFIAGFDAIVSVVLFHDSPSECELSGKIGNEEFNIPLTFHFSPNRYLCEGIKERKLNKIFSILQCPHCHSSNFSRYEGYIQCGHCNARFSKNMNAYNFLTDDLKSIGGVKPTGNVSSNNYDPSILDIIEKNPNKMILDNGAGLRSQWYENVVNFEIVSYPSTDVIGIGELLPFKKESFDIVLSLAVLEHVKNPFRCAEEIVRVLKPGGTLVVVVPFLQPFHGYPDHYYNMTSNGLKNLFKDDIEVIDCYVPRSGLPVYCLTWFLREYINSLPEKTATQFKNLTIGDLIRDAQDYLNDPFVTDLTPSGNMILACTNYLIGRKK